MIDLKIESDVELARHSSLELGGRARFLAEASTENEVRDLLLWARSRGEEVVILGGGSNVVISDQGFDGLVIRMVGRGVRVEESGEDILVTACAGETWDDLVASTVARGWAGLECLSGIPGSVGATPIQNVGAYGREVAESLVWVRVVDRSSLETVNLPACDCELSYRSSLFRRDASRFVVVAATFRLRPGADPILSYPELAARIRARGATPTLREVRRTVLELRREKSMVLDPEDANRRSVGSFFLNPVVSPEKAAEISNRARRLGVIDRSDEMPRFPSPDGVKIPAAWLIQRAGFEPGTRRGKVGLSSRHSLALVHHGGGSTVDLLALAQEILEGVLETFGVELRPEPVFLGFSENPLI